MHAKSMLACVVAGGMMLIGQALAADAAMHAVAGAIEKVDKSSKTFVLKTANGTEHVFKYTAETTVRAAKETGKAAKKGALEAYMAGKEGTHVLVHYTGEGADKTAVHVEDYGKDALKTSEGTITKVDKSAHTVTIKTKDGAEETYSFSKDLAVETEKGVVKDAKEGEKVTVHYTEEAGKRVAELFHRL